MVKYNIPTVTSIYSTIKPRIINTSHLLDVGQEHTSINLSTRSHQSKTVFRCKTRSLECVYNHAEEFSINDLALNGKVNKIIPKEPTHAP
jgi:hypothetical protein